MELTPRLDRVMERAREVAASSQARVLGVEHVVAALLEDEAVVETLFPVFDADVTAERLRAFLSDELDPRFPTAPHPWASEVIIDEAGEPMISPDGRILQFFIDANGDPVLDASGARVHVVWDPDGQPLSDDDGRFVLEPIEGSADQ